MALCILVDCSTMKIGNAQIARPDEAAFSVESNEITSLSDALMGHYDNDITYYDLKARLTAEDPINIPTVAALTSAYEIAATGQLSNLATYQTIKLGHGVLVGVDMDLVDNQPGKVGFDLQNRAASASATVANEYTQVSGTAPTLVNRRNAIRIVAASSTFTPDAGQAVALEGLSRVNWKAQAMVQASSSPGALCVDQLTILGWVISGSISFFDKTLVTTQSLAARLAVMARGTMAVQCRMTGFAGESAVGNQIITLQRVKFGRMGEGLKTKQQGSGDLQFNAILKSSQNVAMVLADMLTVAAA